MLPATARVVASGASTPLLDRKKSAAQIKGAYSASFNCVAWSSFVAFSCMCASPALGPLIAAMTLCANDMYIFPNTVVPKAMAAPVDEVSRRLDMLLLLFDESVKVRSGKRKRRLEAGTIDYT